MDIQFNLKGFVFWRGVGGVKFIQQI